MSEPSIQGAADPGGPARADRERIVERIVERIASLQDLAEHASPPDWLEQDLSMGQMRLLFLLESQGPVPMSRIAEKLGIGMPAASGFVERVERHGLVRRSHREDDRRIVECDLTEAGRDLVAHISGRRNQYTRRILDLLTTDELDQLDRLLAAAHERITPARNLA